MVTIGKKYQLNKNGDPILDAAISRPKLVDNKVDELPILGIPLLSFKHIDPSLIGKGTSDELWQVFSSMIMYQAAVNKDGQLGQMPLEKMIDAREEFMNVEDMINKARTYGIPVKNHGRGEDFKKQVETYNNIIDYYMQQVKNSEEGNGPGDSPTNIRVNLQGDGAKSSPVHKR